MIATGIVITMLPPTLLEAVMIEKNSITELLQAMYSTLDPA
jgi:hypothetical protein